MEYVIGIARNPDSGPGPPTPGGARSAGPRPPASRRGGSARPLPDQGKRVPLPPGGRQAGGAAGSRRRRIRQSPLHRHLVAGLDASGPDPCEELYCAKGDAENRVKDLKLSLFDERCSSCLFDANTLRLQLSAFAHVLHNRLARAFAGTRIATHNPETFRLRLLKIGARVRISVRRIHVAMSESCPDQEAFIAAWRALAPA